MQEFQDFIQTGRGRGCRLGTEPLQSIGAPVSLDRHVPHLP